MNRVFRVPAGTVPCGLVVGMTDSDWADDVNQGPSIGEAYAKLGRVRSTIGSACKYARVWRGPKVRNEPTTNAKLV